MRKRNRFALFLSVELKTIGGLYTVSHREYGQFRPCKVMKILKNSRWFRPRRAVGFDRAGGAIESNCPSTSKSSRIFQNFHDHRDGTVHTLDGIQCSQIRSKKYGISKWLVVKQSNCLEVHSSIGTTDLSSIGCCAVHLRVDIVCGLWKSLIYVCTHGPRGRMGLFGWRIIVVDRSLGEEESSTIRTCLYPQPSSFSPPKEESARRTLFRATKKLFPCRRRGGVEHIRKGQADGGKVCVGVWFCLRPVWRFGDLFVRTTNFCTRASRGSAVFTRYLLRGAPRRPVPSKVRKFFSTVSSRDTPGVNENRSRARLRFAPPGPLSYVAMSEGEPRGTLPLVADDVRIFIAPRARLVTHTQRLRDLVKFALTKVWPQRFSLSGWHSSW